MRVRSFGLKGGELKNPKSISINSGFGYTNPKKGRQWNTLSTNNE